MVSAETLHVCTIPHLLVMSLLQCTLYAWCYTYIYIKSSLALPSKHKLSAPPRGCAQTARVQMQRLVKCLTCLKQKEKKCSQCVTVRFSARCPIHQSIVVQANEPSVNCPLLRPSHSVGLGAGLEGTRRAAVSEVKTTWLGWGDCALCNHKGLFFFLSSCPGNAKPTKVQ